MSLMTKFARKLTAARAPAQAQRYSAPAAAAQTAYKTTPAPGPGATSPPTSPGSRSLGRTQTAGRAYDQARRQSPALLRLL
jgi:hypothetical protein